MSKKRNKKMSFPAYRRMDNTFQIKDLEGALKPGQKVLISQETDEPIVHFSTGKEIGKVEIKLGVGNVVTQNDQRGTVTVRVGNRRSLSNPFNTAVNIPKISNAIVEPEQLRRIAAIKGIAAPKSFKRKTPARYIAKIIE